ncbi:hypothetical protein PPERSA_01536 [Pseudocohnilembus persalinus]|uniref:Tyrosine-protein phosphatase domain-containing protein n=1 Tax=Pseudocohnilembus persalinus TaxID=266149 RepID=A0A0V0R7P1_PSEPJ|nr:hypothetical protein PPERSA_01536 [Pseudocohnilembus persalinus]|eukprot:KRX10524.1 hypothetical protein PPERSA_01536 [Pseudocohnilembus persalinus]
MQMSMDQIEDNQQFPVIDGSEQGQDLSYKWVAENKDINLINQGVPLVLFNKLTPKRNTEFEYRIIRRITETQFHNDKLIDFKPNLAKLNRYSNIIPYKHSQVVLNNGEQQQQLMNDDDEDEMKEFNSYINACWVNSIFGPDKAIIATQGPKQESLDHFWNMAYQTNVENIIMLCRLKENEKIQCEQYWPTVNYSKIFGQIEAKTIKEEIIYEQIIKRTIQLSKIEQNQTEENNSEDQQQNQSVEPKIFLAWPDHQVPQEEDFKLVETIVKKMVDSFNNKKQSVVHYSYDMENVYSEQPQFIKQMCDETGKLSIFSLVRRLREQRWGMVHTSEQYSYLYKYSSKEIQRIIDEVDDNNNTVNQDEKLENKNQEQTDLQSQEQCNHQSNGQNGLQENNQNSNQDVNQNGSHQNSSEQQNEQINEEGQLNQNGQEVNEENLEQI